MCYMFVAVSVSGWAWKFCVRRDEDLSKWAQLSACRALCSSWREWRPAHTCGRAACCRAADKAGASPTPGRGQSCCCSSPIASFRDF